MPFLMSNTETRDHLFQVSLDHLSPWAVLLIDGAGLAIGHLKLVQIEIQGP